MFLIYAQTYNTSEDTKKEKKRERKWKGKKPTKTQPSEKFVLWFLKAAFHSILVNVFHFRFIFFAFHQNQNSLHISSFDHMHTFFLFDEYTISKPNDLLPVQFPFIRNDKQICWTSATWLQHFIECKQFSYGIFGFTGTVYHRYIYQIMLNKSK